MLPKPRISDCLAADAIDGLLEFAHQCWIVGPLALTGGGNGFRDTAKY